MILGMLLCILMLDPNLFVTLVPQAREAHLQGREPHLQGRRALSEREAEALEEKTETEEAQTREEVREGTIEIEEGMIGIEEEAEAQEETTGLEGKLFSHFAVGLLCRRYNQLTHVKIGIGIEEEADHAAETALHVTAIIVEIHTVTPGL